MGIGRRHAVRNINGHDNAPVAFRLMRPSDGRLEERHTQASDDHQPQHQQSVAHTRRDQPAFIGIQHADHDGRTH